MASCAFPSRDAAQPRCAAKRKPPQRAAGLVRVASCRVERRFAPIGDRQIKCQLLQPKALAAADTLPHLLRSSRSIALRQRGEQAAGAASLKPKPLAAQSQQILALADHSLTPRYCKRPSAVQLAAQPGCNLAGPPLSSLRNFWRRDTRATSRSTGEPLDTRYPTPRRRQQRRHIGLS
jgi:hypothetical protein